MAVAQKSGVCASTCFGCSRVLHSREASPTAAPSLKDLDAHYRGICRKAADGFNCVAIDGHTGICIPMGMAFPPIRPKRRVGTRRHESCQLAPLPDATATGSQYKGIVAAAGDPGLYPMLFCDA